MEFPRYENYKDSGVEWVGEIPEHWQLLKSKFIWEEAEERSENGSELLLSVSQNAGIIPRGEQSRSESLANYKKCSEGDLVINIMLAWMGGLGVSEVQGIVSPAYCIYRLNTKNNSKYLGYLYRTPNYLAEFARRSTGVVPSRWRMYTEDFGQVQTILPPLEEQERIARFLDEKTAVIDSAIAKKERLIRLLEEQKQILVQTAVTRGLNPNAPTRPSGIDWIGDIPAHWEVEKLRYLGQCQNGINIGAQYFGSGYPFISYGDVYNNRELPKKASGLVQSSESDQIHYSVKAGDVFFTRTSETIEEIGFSSVCFETIDKATFAGFLIRFRPSEKSLNPRFSKYYFQNILLRAFFVKEMNLVTRASLSQDLLKKMPVLVPSLEEQNKIVQYLEDKSAKIDLSIERANEAIVLLKEYRSILIAEAVTGKIKI